MNHIHIGKRYLHICPHMDCSQVEEEEDRLDNQDTQFEAQAHTSFS